MMTDADLTPTDDAIERGIASRAPRGAGGGLLGDVMTLVRETGQVSRWGVALRDPIGGVRRPVVWAALVAALSVALAAAVLGSGAGLTRPATIVTPTESAAPTAQATATGTPVACATDTIVAAAVAHGTRTDPRASFPGLGSGRIAYLTEDGIPSEDSQSVHGVEVWVASRGGSAPDLVATFTGQGINMASLARWSPGNPSLALIIGHVSPSGFSQACTDVYLIAVDGSAVTRLTHGSAGFELGDVQLAPSGAAVAYRTFPTPTRPDEAFAVMDATGAKVADVAGACQRAPGVGMAWAPDSRRLAIPCSSQLDIVDVSSGQRASIEHAISDVRAIRWLPDGTVLEVMVLSPAMNQVAIARIDPTARTWTSGVSTDVADTAAPVAISPDGRSVLISPVDPVAGEATSVLDIATGRLRLVLEPDKTSVDLPVTWSADASTFVFLDLADEARPTLRSQPIDGSPARPIGVLPPWSPKLNGVTILVDLP